MRPLRRRQGTGRLRCVISREVHTLRRDNAGRDIFATETDPVAILLNLVFDFNLRQSRLRQADAGDQRPADAGALD